MTTLLRLHREDPLAQSPYPGKLPNDSDGDPLKACNRFMTALITKSRLFLFASGKTKKSHCFYAYKNHTPPSSSPRLVYVNTCAVAPAWAILGSENRSCRDENLCLTRTYVNMRTQRELIPHGNLCFTASFIPLCDIQRECHDEVT